MSRDPLIDLLSETDALLPPPRSSGPMADQVRRQAARQARMRVAHATIAILACATMILHSARTHPRLVRDIRPSPSINEAAQCRAQIEMLEAEANVHQKAAEQLMAVERRDESIQRIEVRSIQGSNPLSYLDQARDRTARIMLMDADRSTVETGRNVRAVEIYRRAVRLFPETPAAREAAERLGSLGA